MFEIELFIFIKIDLVLNYVQWLMCHKTKPNKPAQAKSFLYSLEQAARGIDLYMNTNKTKFMHFKQRTISTLSSKPLKLLDLITYLGNHISSTESNVDIYLAKALTAYQSYGNLIKWDFFKAVDLSYYMDAPHGC